MNVHVSNLEVALSCVLMQLSWCISLTDKVRIQQAATSKINYGITSM